MAKLFRILKIITLLFLFGGLVYLLVLKDGTKPEAIQDNKGDVVSETVEKTSFVESDGTYEFSGDKVSVSVELPQKDEGYLASIYEYGNQQIERFVSDEDEFKNTISESFPWNLDLGYKKTESQKIVSYLVEGYEYTGGAHGNTFFKSFNFEKSTGREINLEDIIASNSTLKTLSGIAKKELLVEYPEGVDENPENWSVWYVDGTSINFVFVPYQIAPYSAGGQILTIDTQNEEGLFKQEYFQ